MFGAPNGLCSSITESKHIKAVKEPWRRSNKYNPLDQMLLTNQRLDKLAAIRVRFAAQGLLDGSYHIPNILSSWSPLPVLTDLHDGEAVREANEDDDEDVDDGPRVDAHVVLAKCPEPAWKYPRNLQALAQATGYDQLPALIRRFLYDQFHPDDDISGADIDLNACPTAPHSATVYPSAVAIYYAPSDTSGLSGMHRERIRSLASWRGGPERRDCVFVNSDSSVAGFRGLHVARVLLFFSFAYGGVKLPCALVHWFSAVGEEPCPDTGMWIVEPDFDRHGLKMLGVIHTDSIVRGAHLLGVAGEDFIPHDLQHTDTLDAFRLFYVNKYADHHAHTIAF